MLGAPGIVIPCAAQPAQRSPFTSLDGWVWGFALVSPNAEGSHFRYGTVRWSPTQRTIRGEAFEAEFRLQLAYRKDYAWGTSFKEAWRDTSDPIAGTDWQMALAMTVAGSQFDCASGCNDFVQCFDPNCAFPWSSHVVGSLQTSGRYAYAEWRAAKLLASVHVIVRHIGRRLRRLPHPSHRTATGEG
jgi:hypothetical protein